MFFGEYRHNIDAKGRLSIPAKMRNQCTESVFVTRGNDGCLALYTKEGWDAYYQELQKLPRKKRDTRALVRINIPLVLRNEGNLKKECIIIGVGDHIELWNSEAWDEFYDAYKDSFDDISEGLDEVNQ